MPCPSRAPEHRHPDSVRPTYLTCPEKFFSAGPLDHGVGLTNHKYLVQDSIVVGRKFDHEGVLDGAALLVEHDGHLGRQGAMAYCESTASALSLSKASPPRAIPSLHGGLPRKSLNPE